MAAIARCVDTGQCDCANLKLFVMAAVAALAAAAAIRADKKTAMRLAVEAIKRAQASSKAAVGRIELEHALSALAGLAALQEAEDAALQNLLDQALEMEQSAFEHHEERPVIIHPPEV